MIEKKYNVAVVGATGLVGRTMLSILEERNFPVDKVYALASSRSVGTRIPFKDGELVVGDLETFNFNLAKIGFFSAGASISAIYAPKAVDAGCVVIDNTSKFRYEDDIPLVVSEVNPHAIGDYKNRGIIANPNCSTIQMVVALNPLHKAAEIKRVVVSTYQSTAGAGAKGMNELLNQTRAWANGEALEVSSFPSQILFNLFPHVDIFMENGYTKEEMKMINETKKIMNAPNMGISATCVRVPVLRSHSEAVWIETEKKITPEEAREILKKSPGLIVRDEPANGGYPMPWDVDETVETFVGRIREDFSHPKGLTFWVVADNLNKGAALNSIQIAEVLEAG